MTKVKIGKILIMLGLMFGWNIGLITRIEATGTVNHLLITEVYYDTIGTDSLEEWIEIYNPTKGTVDLSGYKIGDEETKSGNESMYQFPPGLTIESLASLVVAKNAIGFYDLYGKYPEIEIDTADDEVSDFSRTPNMTKYTSWAGGSLSFTNTGDEVLLLDNNDNLVDAVVFESGNVLGITPHSGVGVGESITRSNTQIDTDNCAIDFEREVSPHPGYDWIYEVEEGFSQNGTKVADNNASGGFFLSAEQDQTMPGYLVYGPYRTDQTAGMYQARFRIRLNNNAATEPVVRIEVFNNGGSGNYEEKIIVGTDFKVTNNWEYFDLWFDRVDEGNMEFRVWWPGNVSIGVDEVMISKVDRIIYEAEELMHGVGTKVDESTASGLSAWQITPGAGINYAIYGPYDGLAKGNYEIIYVLKTDNNIDENTLATLNLNNTFGSDQFKDKIVKNNQLISSNMYQAFSFGFGRHDSGVLEYRVLYQDNNILTIDNIIVQKMKGVRYETEDLFGNTGSMKVDLTASGQKVREAKITENESGWMQFGPYTTEQKAGDYTAKFRLKTADNSSGEAVAWISAYNFGGSGIEESRPIWGTEFTATNTWQDFDVDFTRVEEGAMEYRVYFTDLTDIAIDYVEVEEK